MKTVILAGGMGSRLQEETVTRPKPMVEIGGRPILWHIMSLYAAYGHDEFVVALGYKGQFIKDYFLNFYALNNDLTVDLSDGTTTVHDGRHPNWKVHLVDTGLNTLTGGRVKRVQQWVGAERCMLTYGDGLADVNLNELIAFHESHGKLATVTAVRPPSRFGSFSLEGERVLRFEEKPQAGEGWINGGFFVLEPGFFDYLEDDQTILEREPMERLAQDGELVAYRHSGFFQPMDTIREKQQLEQLWASGNPPWKVWKG